MEALAAKRAAQEPAEPRPAKRGCFFGPVVPEQLTLEDCLAQLAEDAPDELVCPIMHDLFKEPVVAADCNTYENDAIVRWLGTNYTSPVTNMYMADKTVRASRTVKGLVSKWVERQLAVASAALVKARAGADSESGMQALDRVWALLELADAKRVVGLLEEAFWARLPDAPFTKRMDHFRQAAAKAGLPARQACIKAYTLAAGHQSFDCASKQVDLQEPQDPLSFLLPAAQHMRVYHFPFPAVDSVKRKSAESKLFHIAGIGACRVRLSSLRFEPDMGLMCDSDDDGVEEHWMAHLLVLTPCPLHEVRPVICSFAAPGSSRALAMWFQFAPTTAAEELIRGGRVWTGKLPADFALELAVRGLVGFEEQVAMDREDEEKAKAAEEEKKAGAKEEMAEAEEVAPN